MKTLVRTLAAGLVVASVASASGDQPEGGLLIITTDSFADIVEPLAEWKREKGLFTTVVTTSDINPDTTPSPTEIDNYIELVADSMQAGLSYVLIVGSSRLVLSSDGGEYYTDCPYGDTTSGYPMEMPVGRLPVDDARQCSTLITKTLEYERPAPGADTAWYRKGCTVIREDGDSDDTIYWNDSRIAHGHWKADSFIVIDSLSDSAGHSSSHVTQAARDGRAFITYRGTAVIYWRQPFDSLLADTWRNGHRTPIVVAATCETVELGPYVTWPYGNEFVCAGSSDSLGGAVAYFGTSHTGERIARQRSTCFRGFLHGVYHDGESRIGNATLRARHWVDSLNMGRSRYEEWNLLGDPTMHMWTGGVPRTPQLTWSPDTIYRTTMKLAVTVSVDGTPVTGALVCLRKGNELHVAARTDTSGVAILKPGAHGSGWVMLTVSEGHVPAGNSILPYQDSVYSLGKGGWGEVASMPVWPGPSPRRVYKGGWLAYNEGNGLIYGAKGHKTVDFYSYEPDSNLWSAALRGMPYHTHPVWFRKRPHDGSKGVCDGDNVIYVTQGYNTCGWWAYSISADSWYYLADVPLGDSRKKVKYGTDLAYVPGDTDYVYCLKGYRSEFHRYDISADSWEELDAVPGIYQGPKWDRGSWLVWDGDRYLYAHRARYHELHRYDLETQSWDTAFAGMPFMGMKVQWKKSKGGGSAVWVDSLIFALKGGNSQEFWMYSPAANEWAELETIPAYGSTERKKRVRHGADVVFAEGAFYALKGNRTVELWCYVMRPEDTVWGVAGRRKAALDGGFGEETICEGVEAERPRWSPNGQYICYFKDVDGYNQIFMKEYGSQEPEVQLTDIETDCENPVFSLQNDWIAFQMDDTVEGFWQICRVSTSESDWGGVDGRTPEGSVSTSGFPTAADPCVSAEVSPVHQAPAEVPGLDYDIEQLTTVTEADHENPEYSPDGTKLAFQRDLDGYYQICIMSSEGGDVTQLTTDEADHEWPVWLDNNTIVYQKWPDEDYVQLYKVDVVTQTETWLTNGNFDHELPCADSGSQVTYQVMDDDGVYQIGLVSAGGGDEEMLTESDQDLEQPDWSQDNTSIYATRCHGLCNSIVLVDAVEGGFQAVTDSNAIRENPDTWYDKEGTNNNFVIYSREDTSTSGTFGQGGRGRRYKHGTGIFLTRAIRARGGGMMSAGITAVQLFRATPNPAAGPVRIRWQLPKLGQVSLKAYNIAGQCVATMVDAQAKPGVYETLWTGCDNHGRRLGAGVYFYTLKTEDEKLTHKVVLTNRE